LGQLARSLLNAQQRSSEWGVTNMTNLKTSFGASVWAAMSAILLLAALEPVSVAADPVQVAAAPAAQAAA
jgi:hypothetical protein